MPPVAKIPHLTVNGSDDDISTVLFGDLKYMKVVVSEFYMSTAYRGQSKGICRVGCTSSSVPGFGMMSSAIRRWWGG
jgi:hypothetical protein